MRFSLNVFVLAVFLALAVVEATPLGRRELIAARAGKNQKGNAVAKSSNSASATSNSSAASNSSATSSSTATSNSTASGTTTAASATRTRPCDQGDQSLAAGLQANVIVGIGQQASVLTIQSLLASGGAASDVQDGITRLTQFLNTSALQIQMAAGIADSGSFAQPQLALLASAQSSQQQLVSSLTGTASDNSTLNQLLESFTASTDNSQDGASNALIDCFLPLTAVSG
ncbi:hypothetical protein BDP27DRAFT_1439106 [Rhodocollybia butyracea]|uniref:Uncharacterized protein n=1 Tax=Rhodocollybia butyracea TaxID=206335 RepID=A0A9P5P073_9AGAR|nr:hypothetical protein BDP27DRAFT_1439106 [Rhodocollybia butyracea]